MPISQRSDKNLRAFSQHSLQFRRPAPISDTTPSPHSLRQEDRVELSSDAQISLDGPASIGNGDVADIGASANSTFAHLRETGSGLASELGGLHSGFLGVWNAAEAGNRWSEGDRLGAAISGVEAAGDLSETVASTARTSTRLAAAAPLLRTVAPIAGAIEGIHQIATAERENDRVSGSLKAAAGTISLVSTASGVGAIPGNILAGALYGTSIAMDHTQLDENFLEHGFGQATWEEMSVAP